MRTLWQYWNGQPEIYSDDRSTDSDDDNSSDDGDDEVVATKSTTKVARNVSVIANNDAAIYVHV